MKHVRLLFMILCCVSCGKKEYDLTVKGQVKGLKKGTVYLKKINDSAVITVDSLVINGHSEFVLHSDLESPEIFFLYLDKNSNNNERIHFFADKGTTEIYTSVKNFATDAQIKGSKQQEILEEYRDMMSRLNNANLDLIKENIEAKISGDTAKLNTIENTRNSIIKRKYLYTINFAINNRSSEVAPYLALTEIYDAQLKFLDTINNSLTAKVKSSKYGKDLQNLIDRAKTSQE